MQAQWVLPWALSSHAPNVRYDNVTAVHRTSVVSYNSFMSFLNRQWSKSPRQSRTSSN